MKIFELLRNPLIKYPGILLVLYFGLFSNKENPDSLGNRLSSEAIKKNFGEMQEKGKFISENLQAAKDLEAQRKRAKENALEIKTEDLEIGNSQEAIACGDEVEVSYGIYDSSNNQLEFIEKEKLFIGSKNNVLLEQNIVGAKQGGIRIINIPRYFVISDKKLMDFLKFSNSDLKIQVTILVLKKDAGTSGISCEKIIPKPNEDTESNKNQNLLPM